MTQGRAQVTVQARWRTWLCRRRGEHAPRPWTPLIPLAAQPWEWAEYGTRMRCHNCGWEGPLEPIPPTNVTAETRGGTVIPLDGTYLGIEYGIHVWQYTIRGTVASVHADVVPPMTALRFVQEEP